MNRTFNPESAAAAQEAYCEEHGIPMFAPKNGCCPNCCRNIYLPISNGIVRLYGVSVQEAGERVISGCPHCHKSFVG